MFIEATLFDTIYDNNTDKMIYYDNYDEFEKYLYKLSKEIALKPNKNEPVQAGIYAPLISPAVYKIGTTRSKDNVDYWGGWASLDVDDGTDFREIFKKSEYRITIFNTASSRKDYPKFRIITPLTRKINNDEFPAFWYAYHKLFGEHGDIQTKDISRMFFIPGKYPDAFSFFLGSKKSMPYCNPDILMAKYPLPKNYGASKISSKMMEDLKNLRKKQLTNVYTWTSYKDCPFVNQSMVLDYLSSNEGWYSKLYAIMVSIASNALKKKYMISVDEIVELVREIDDDDGGWYNNRPLEVEASRAFEYALSNL